MFTAAEMCRQFSLDQAITQPKPLHRRAGHAGRSIPNDVFMPTLQNPLAAAIDEYRVPGACCCCSRSKWCPRRDVQSLCSRWCPRSDERCAARGTDVHGTLIREPAPAELHRATPWGNSGVRFEAAWCHCFLPAAYVRATSGRPARAIAWVKMSVA